MTVNCIAPGYLDIPSHDLQPERTDEIRLKKTEERKKRIPSGRLGSPEDIGPAVVYFASPASDYATGTTIFIDGGMNYDQSGMPNRRNMELKPELSRERPISIGRKIRAGTFIAPVILLPTIKYACHRNS